MIPQNWVGTEVMIKPQSQATNADATGIIDTKGANHLNVNFALDTQASATSKPAILKLQEADETAATAFVDIKEFVGDGAGGFVIPAADVANPQVIRMGVTLIGRMRYIKAVFRPSGAAQHVCVTGSVSRGSDSTQNVARNTLFVEG